MIQKRIIYLMKYNNNNFIKIFLKEKCIINPKYINFFF